MLDIFIIVNAVILGLLVGSFLNVVALRFNTGKSLGGRSGCYSCGHQLSWYELVPLFSWLIQKGRCRSCGSHISSLYITGELTVGIFFGLIAARGIIAGFDWFSVSYGISTLFLFVIFSILAVILMYDVRHKIIPDSLSLAFGLMSFLGMFFFGFDTGVFNYIGFHIPDMWHMLGGVLVPLPFVVLWLVSKGRWLGLGDPKLMVGMGFLFGTTQGFTSVFVSFWIGALFALSIFLVNFFLKKQLLRTGKKSIMKEELPFAPFLIIATLITVVFNINLF